eukprot:scaffold13095_cov90-Isochrysis_galbana.AAC.2
MVGGRTEAKRESAPPAEEFALLGHAGVAHERGPRIQLKLELPVRRILAGKAHLWVLRQRHPRPRAGRPARAHRVRAPRHPLAGARPLTGAQRCRRLRLQRAEPGHDVAQDAVDGQRHPEPPQVGDSVERPSRAAEVDERGAHLAQPARDGGDGGGERLPQLPHQAEPQPFRMQPEQLLQRRSAGGFGSGTGGSRFSDGRLHRQCPPADLCGPFLQADQHGELDRCGAGLVHQRRHRGRIHHAGALGHVDRLGRPLVSVPNEVASACHVFRHTVHLFRVQDVPRGGGRAGRGGLSLADLGAQSCGRAVIAVPRHALVHGGLQHGSKLGQVHGRGSRLLMGEVHGRWDRS